MTEEQIKQNAEDWVKPLIGEEDGKYNEIDVSLSLMKNAFIAGAHSRDEEIKELYQRIDNLVAIAREQSKPWFSSKENKPEAVKQKEFGARKLSKQVLAMYEDGKCHVVRYDYDCQCWRWANSYGQMFEPKMWRYIDIPEGGIK